jgi:hypothetical protein
MFCRGLTFDGPVFLEALKFAAETGIGLTEQTLFAAMTRRLGGRSFAADEIYLSDEDRFTRGATFAGQPWSARHYIGQVRHLFWRDAYALARRHSGGDMSAIA